MSGQSDIVDDVGLSQGGSRVLSAFALLAWVVVSPVVGTPSRGNDDEVVADPLIGLFLRPRGASSSEGGEETVSADGV